MTDRVRAGIAGAGFLGPVHARAARIPEAVLESPQKSCWVEVDAA